MFSMGPVRNKKAAATSDGPSFSIPLGNRKPLVFWCSQMVSKETSGMKRVKTLPNLYG